MEEGKKIYKRKLLKKENERKNKNNMIQWK